MERTAQGSHGHLPRELRGTAFPLVVSPRPFPEECSQEPLPEPTAAEIAREAEQEAAVFSQAANVDRLLMMLRNMDPVKDNLADDEEIQVRIRHPVNNFFAQALHAGALPLVYDAPSKDCQVD